MSKKRRQRGRRPFEKQLKKPQLATELVAAEVTLEYFDLEDLEDLKEIDKLITKELLEGENQSIIQRNLAAFLDWLKK